MNCEIKDCMHNINSSPNRIDVLRSRMIRMLYKILLFITSLFENIFLQQTQHKRSNTAAPKIMKDGAQSVIKFSITHTNPPLFIIYIRIYSKYISFILFLILYFIFKLEIYGDLKVQQYFGTGKCFHVLEVFYGYLLGDSGLIVFQYLKAAMLIK